MRTTGAFRARRLTTALVATVLGVSGCGEREPAYRVTGTVTFNGRPVPVGKIYFTPDGGLQNVGATGYANIRNGAFDTAAAGGRAVVGGAMLVAIEGGDPPPDLTSEHSYPALFPRYEVKLELPKGDSTHQFDVPARATRR